MIHRILALFAIPAIAFSQGSTNDYIFYQKPATGPLVPRAVTPTAGRLMGWPSSINAPASIIIGSGLSLTGGTLSSTGGTPAWADITGKPTTLSGFGITDGQPLDADLTAIAALTTTTIGRSLLAGADAAALRTILALGTAATGTLATAVTNGAVPLIHNAAGTPDRAITGFSSTGRIFFATPVGTGSPVWNISPTLLGQPKIGAGSGSFSSLEFYDSTGGSGDNFVALRAPNDVVSNVTFVLPGADGTNGQALVTNGSGTLSFATVGAGGATLSANTFTGLQQFSGTDHAGLRLNNLTTAQRDAIASPAAGMAIWNTTASRLQLHNGTGWTAGMVRLDGDTMTGALINSTNGALSTPSFTLTGSIITGGTATTTKPLALIEPTGATSTGWSTSGTALGVNAGSGFTGNLFDFQINGSRRLSLSGTVLSPGSSGGIDLGAYNMGFGTLRVRNVQAESGTGTTGASLSQDFGISLGATGMIRFGESNSDPTTAMTLFILRAATATLQLGQNTAVASATAIGQTIKGPNATGTTSTGGSLTIQGGTGTSSGGAVIISTSATTTPAARMTIKASGVINVSGIPTSSAGLVTGDLWSDGGTIKVIP